MLLSLHHSVSTAGESCSAQAYRPQQLEVDMEQRADAFEPVVKFSIEGAAAVLCLTLDEAEQVRTAIGRVVALARDGDNQPIAAAQSLAGPAPTPDRPSPDRDLLDRVVHDEGLTAGQKISVLRGAIAELLTQQGLSVPERASRLNCTEQQAVDAVMDFAMWSHAGYLLPPTKPAQPPCPVWCEGNCHTEDGDRLHTRHMAAVYGIQIDDADDLKLARSTLKRSTRPTGTVTSRHR
ncbi:hypothetical protein [Micromonospora sp. NPDC004704]